MRVSRIQKEVLSFALAQPTPDSREAAAGEKYKRQQNASNSGSTERLLFLIDVVRLVLLRNMSRNKLSTKKLNSRSAANEYTLETY